MQLVERQISAGALEKPILIFKLFTHVLTFTISIAYSKICQMLSVDHVCRCGPGLAGVLRALKNSPQPSHSQITDFVLLSQETNEKLLPVGQLRFDAAWPTVLVLDPKDKGSTVDSTNTTSRNTWQSLPGAHALISAIHSSSELLSVNFITRRGTEAAKIVAANLASLIESISQSDSIADGRNRPRSAIAPI
ncbi:hypothetical protein V2J74_03900 [Pseudomonas alliivorans]|nr:hypothetical protein [Pseudomonas alliivorans]